MSTPEDVAALLKALPSMCGAGCEGRCLNCPDDVIRDTLEALTDQRATIAAQDEAGRLANITTARAVERAEKAEAVVERLERALDEAKAISQGWELQAGEAEAEARETVDALKIAEVLRGVDDCPEEIENCGSCKERGKFSCVVAGEAVYAALSPARRQRRTGEMVERELPTSEVAKLCGVKPYVLRKWKVRGFLKLAPQGVSGQGRSVECVWSKEATDEALAWSKLPRTRREARGAQR